MIGRPASSKRRCQYGLPGDEHRHAVHHRTARLQDLLGVPLGRFLRADGEVVDDHVGAGLAEDLHDIVGVAGRLVDHFGDVLAEPIVGHAARDGDAGLGHVGELDRVVWMRPDRVGKVLADFVWVTSNAAVNSTSRT